MEVTEFDENPFDSTLTMQYRITPSYAVTLYRMCMALSLLLVYLAPNSSSRSKLQNSESSKSFPNEAAFLPLKLLKNVDCHCVKSNPHWLL